MLKTATADIAGKVPGVFGYTIDDDGAFSVKEFCDRYDIGLTAFYEEVNEGRLIVKKRGSRTLVPRGNARAWFASLPNFEPQTESVAA
jgi:hypothetical protein